MRGSSMLVSVSSVRNRPSSSVPARCRQTRHAEARGPHRRRTGSVRPSDNVTWLPATVQTSTAPTTSTQLSV